MDFSLSAVLISWDAGYVLATERRVTTMASAGSIKLPSPAPVAVSAHAGSSSNIGGAVTQRSRLSQQVHPRHSPARPRRVSTPVGPDVDDDAEGEEDVEDIGEENGDVEDKELYCFCQKLSYGEVRLLFKLSDLRLGLVGLLLVGVYMRIGALRK